jgi:hypothetical protein
VVSEKKIFLEIDQSGTIIDCGGHVYSRIGTKCEIFIEDFHIGFLSSFGSFGRAVSEEKILKIKKHRIACSGHVC